MLTGDRANRRNSTRPKTIWLRATRASASISSLSTKHWEMGGNHFLNRERRRYEFVWTNATDREHSYCTQEHNCDRRRYPGRRIRLPSFARESFRSRNARPHRLAVASGPPASWRQSSFVFGRFQFWRTDQAIGREAAAVEERDCGAAMCRGGALVWLAR